MALCRRVRWRVCRQGPGRFHMTHASERGAAHEKKAQLPHCSYACKVLLRNVVKFHIKCATENQTRCAMQLVHSELHDHPHE